jgi:hypothetical protein
MRTSQQSGMVYSTRSTIRAPSRQILDQTAVQYSRRVNLSIRMAKSGRGEEGRLQRAWLAAGVLPCRAMVMSAVDNKE